MQIARSIEMLESKVLGTEPDSVDSLSDDITKKLDPFIERLNEAIGRRQA